MEEDGGAKELLRVNGRTWWPRRFWCSEGVDGVVQGRWWWSRSAFSAAMAAALVVTRLRCRDDEEDDGEKMEVLHRGGSAVFSGVVARRCLREKMEARGAAMVVGKGWRRRLCGGWKERRKLGLGFWEMKMMTWQNLIG